MLKIYLARHGQDEDNFNSILNGQRNMPLTEKGVGQAIELAQKIKSSGITFNKTYCSPLQRAFDTARTVTNTLNIEQPEIMTGLIERDFGVLTGKQHTEIEVFSPHVLKTDTLTYFLDPEGAETFPELLIRGRQILDEVKNINKDGNILLVTHGDIGKMIYAAYYNLEWQEVLKMFHFGNSELLLLSEDSLPQDTHVFKTEQHNL